MSKTNRGKVFEDIVKECLEKDPYTYALRLYDPQGGYAGVANPCDHIAFRELNSKFYMIECKSLHGNTLSIFGNDPKKKYGKISNTQWEEMSRASHYNVVAGVMVWWIDADVTKFIPIQALERIRNSGAKSIRYDLEIPEGCIIEGEKKRVYFDYDFTSFFKKYV